jgi:tryptophan-rich sensory protein
MVTLQQIDRRPKAVLVLVGFLAATFAVAGVSSIFTVAQIPGWYATLVKPSFNPPNQIFGPVWTVLYALMAIAAWRIWKLPSLKLRASGLWIFWVQLALNFGWSFLFFGAHRIGFAAIEIVLLWCLIFAAMVVFFRLDRLAGVFFGLYLAWVSFASVLNLSIWLKN